MITYVHSRVYLRSVRVIHDEKNHFDIKKKEEKRAIQHLLILFPIRFNSRLYRVFFYEDMYIVQTDHSMTYTHTHLFDNNNNNNT